MKSWGVKIALMYTGFVLLIVCMVTMSMRQKVDLVSKDYYEQELKFQEKINKTERANALANPLHWQVQENELLLAFPSQFKGHKVDGEIYFFRPSDASMDKTIRLVADTALTRNVVMNELSSGMYKMQINWRVDGVEYYSEGIIQKK